MKCKLGRCLIKKIKTNLETETAYKKYVKDFFFNVKDFIFNNYICKMYSYRKKEKFKCDRQTILLTDSDSLRSSAPKNMTMLKQILIQLN